MPLSLHVTTYGQGPPLVLIHGWAASARAFSGLALRLSETFKVIVPDLRGHGLSRDLPGPYQFQTHAEDILSLLDNLHIARASLGGWSMGASVALRLVQACPDRVDRLVLIGATPSLVRRDDYPFGLPPVVVRRLAGQVEKHFAQGIQKFHNMVFTGTELEQLGDNPLAGDLPSHKAASDCLQALMQEDARSMLDSVSAPALLIHGSDDTICLPGGARFMQQRIKSADLLMLPETGHAPFLTRPGEVASAILTFLQPLTRTSRNQNNVRVSS